MMDPCRADQVMKWGLEGPLTVAENCCVAPKATFAEAGETTTTQVWRVIAAVPLTEVSATLVAVTVSVFPEAGAV